VVTNSVEVEYNRGEILVVRCRIGQARKSLKPSSEKLVEKGLSKWAETSGGGYPLTPTIGKRKKFAGAEKGFHGETASVRARADNKLCKKNN